MIATLDSSFDAPSPAQAQAARAAGVRAWGGYLATEQTAGAFNLAAPWSRAAFATVQQAGLRAIAFCSGWDDPAGLRQLAAQWNVLLLLDVEDAIRGDGPWVGPFLQASGAGLYGLLAVHHWAAPYRIVADYPGRDPGTTWSTSPAPAEPHGWQWQGTHQEFGLSVDRSWLDDWFGGNMADGFTDSDRQVLSRLATDYFDGVQSLTYDGQTPVPADWPNATPSWLTQILAAVQKLQQPVVDPGALAAALVADQAFLDALTAALLHRAGAALDKA